MGSIKFGFAGTGVPCSNNGCGTAPTPVGKPDFDWAALAAAVSLALDLVVLLTAVRGLAVAEFTGERAGLGAMPIPGKSEGSKIGCVDTDTVPGLIAGERLLLGCLVVLVVLPMVDGIPDFSPGFPDERSRLLISDDKRLSLSGFGAIPDCAALRGKVLRMLGLVV